MRSYARKNVGYLIAIAGGANVIVETDDDNFPRPAFFEGRARRITASVATGTGWLNVYRYFSEANIWPRGLPLDAVNAPLPPFEHCVVQQVDCPIQQGLADENPDVDAIYRLLLPFAAMFPGRSPHCSWQRRVVSVQQPEHDLVGNGFPTALFTCVLFVPDDRHYGEAWSLNEYPGKTVGTSCSTNRPFGRSATNTI